MVSLTERMPEITLLIFIDDQLLNVDEEWVAPTDAIAPSNYKTLNIVFSRIRRLLATGSLFYVWDLETTPTANSHSFIAGIRDLPRYLPSFTGPQFTLYTIVEPFGMGAPSFSSVRISPEGNLAVAVIVAFGLRACMGKPNGCLC